MALKPRPAAICGSPTFTTDRSSDTMNWTTATAASMSPGRALDLFVPLSELSVIADSALGAPD
ncbi:hypothetical protein SSP35_09_01540 [Streptomyces sp. NBRC 110611]|nr:hypothetical protein SSP35_09_01540 [Streptomyces sp. NBRC 110611]